ncbi:MAG: hypothetical protein DRO18_08085 [Thermoprotei archaeon]|nr:MAG: hypothetical protein DRO18_08085 [Thermoprotei archaeon]
MSGERVNIVRDWAYAFLNLNKELVDRSFWEYFARELEELGFRWDALRIMDFMRGRRKTIIDIKAACTESRKVRGLLLGAL